MAMLQVTNTREQKAAVVISTPHYAPSLLSLRHRYTIYPNASHLPYHHTVTSRPLHVTKSATFILEKYNTSTVHTWPSAGQHYTQPPYANAPQCSIRDTDRTHIGGHARTRRASTPSSDPRLQPPPYPIYSSVSCHRLTYHSFGVGTGKVRTPAIVR